MAADTPRSRTPPSSEKRSHSLAQEPPRQRRPSWHLHPSIYVLAWICLSSAVILFNKYILHTLGFAFPILLTTWHLVFATIATQVLARTTHLLDGRHAVPMTISVMLRAILPIGIFFSMSLIFSNQAYLFLPVSFIQMLKATTPVAVLIVTWVMGLEAIDYNVLANVSLIVFGIMIATYGEVNFNPWGLFYQMGGIVFEATRLVMVQSLLSSAEFKMDPLVSLYYFAPVCAVINVAVFFLFEARYLTVEHILRVGPTTLLANAMVAFALNVSVVFLIGKTSSLIFTLCGIFKDILLVAGSVAIWGTSVSALQIFGYILALTGLMIHKIGTKVFREVLLRFKTEIYGPYVGNHTLLLRVFAGSVMLGTIVFLLGRLYIAPEAASTTNKEPLLGRTIALDK
ncbi:triose-phosphate transporter family-domain-containing protein [Peziza echinospora]|nr:triose-phosphate transporter family-domain-containing protein [Peziza echinospora]